MKKTIILFVMVLLTISITSAYRFEILNTNPAPLISGEYADITIQTQAMHKEGVRENVKIRILENNAVQVLGDDYAIIRTFKIGATHTTTFRIFIKENLPTANIPIKFEITDESGVLTATREVFVQRGDRLPNLFIGTVRTVPQDVIRDSKNNLIRINLQNLGDMRAELLTATLTGEDILESNAFSLRDSVASISRGDEKILEFTFDMKDVDKQKTNLRLLLNYQIEDVHGNYKTIREGIDFDLSLTQTPQIRVVKTEKLNEAQLGRSSNKMKITLKNEGLEEAENVRLRLYPDVSYPLDFSRTNQFVSSLMKPQEEATIIIEFDVLRDGDIREYPINVEIESLVGSARYTQRDRITIDVTGESSNMFDLIRNAAIIIAFIIAIFFAVRKLRNKKNDD